MTDTDRDAAPAAAEGADAIALLRKVEFVDVGGLTEEGDTCLICPMCMCYPVHDPDCRLGLFLARPTTAAAPREGDIPAMDPHLLLRKFPAYDPHWGPPLTDQWFTAFRRLWALGAPRSRVHHAIVCWACAFNRCAAGG